MGTFPKAALCIFFQRAVDGELPEVEELSLHVLHLITAVNFSQQKKNHLGTWV